MFFVSFSAQKQKNSPLGALRSRLTTIHWPYYRTRTCARTLLVHKTNCCYRAIFVCLNRVASRCSSAVVLNPFSAPSPGLLTAYAPPCRRKFSYFYGPVVRMKIKTPDTCVIGHFIFSIIPRLRAHCPLPPPPTPPLNLMPPPLTNQNTPRGDGTTHVKKHCSGGSAAVIILLIFDVRPQPLGQRD